MPLPEDIIRDFTHDLAWVKLFDGPFKGAYLQINYMKGVEVRVEIRNNGKKYIYGANEFDPLTNEGYYTGLEYIGFL